MDYQHHPVRYRLEILYHQPSRFIINKPFPLIINQKAWKWKYVHFSKSRSLFH